MNDNPGPGEKSDVRPLILHLSFNKLGNTGLNFLFNGFQVDEGGVREEG